MIHVSLLLISEVSLPRNDYHESITCSGLADRAAGVFVTSSYASASLAGFTIGWLANTWGWQTAGDVQLVLLCGVGAVATLLLRPERMAARRS